MARPTNIPSKPGFYWAKWKQAVDGTQTWNANSPMTPNIGWEVVRVWIDDESEHSSKLSVDVAGEAVVQCIDGFYWGNDPQPIVPPK